jgi:hypothetical protein
MVGRNLEQLRRLRKPMDFIQHDAHESKRPVGNVAELTLRMAKVKTAAAPVDRWRG